jgi:hypothetical protein
MPATKSTGNSEGRKISVLLNCNLSSFYFKLTKLNLENENSPQRHRAHKEKNADFRGSSRLRGLVRKNIRTIPLKFRVRLCLSAISFSFLYPICVFGMKYLIEFNDL